jgi:hypothetical protein
MADDIRVSIFDAISAYNPNFDQRKVLSILFLFFCTVSILCSGVLVYYTDGWSIKYLFAYDFYNKTTDCLWVAVVQCITLLTITSFAVRELQTSNDETKASNDFIQCNCFRCFYKANRKKSSSFSRISVDSQHDSEGNQPLLSREDLFDTKAVNDSVKNDDEEGYEDENIRARNDNRAVDENNLTIKKDKESRKDMWLGVLFIASSASQVYIGLKCISFNYDNQNRDGALMGLGVLWVNIISWILKEYVQKSIKDDGEYLPALHPHRLHLHMSLASHYCDLCGQQCKEGRAFRCKLCDFDLCIICYSKRNKFTLEGQLRGDKGVRRESQLTGDKYFMRSLSLIRSEWVIFSFAIMALLSYNLISLMMPKVQGSILNSVVQDNHDKFYFWIKLYLIISVVSGVFSGIQSLCFNIVGK